VIVFGGTQFLGRLTVHALLDAGHEVVLINRGRTSNPFGRRSNLRLVKADRMGDRERFRAVVKEEGMCDVVIDFVGFQEVYMQDTLEALTLPNTKGGKKMFTTNHYIFVSTDSVYWAQKLPVSDERLREDDAEDFSPPEFEKHFEHCQRTSLGEYQLRYGGNKLGCERVLEEAWQTDGFPYTALRLPDVYGPYDNLGGFWDLVLAIEARRPIPANLQVGRIRSNRGKELDDPKARRFNWVFAEDVRDAILQCMSKAVEVHGMIMNIAHEEAVSLYETAAMIAEGMGISTQSLRFDDCREAALPSTDYGCLDISRALRLLRPWRPSPMRDAVRRSVKWFLSSKENRRYHRLVHREPRFYDETEARLFKCERCEVPACWVGAPEKAAKMREGPVVLNDSLPNFIGQAVLSFMTRLMDQAGEVQVACELQKGPEVERQTWPLRHFAGHLLPQSEHTAAYRLEAPEVLAKTDILKELLSPVADICEDDIGQPPTRVLRLGGAGARTTLQRVRKATPGGFWDCALLGRRKWRFFPPETPESSLCTSANSNESLVDCFTCGPEAYMVQIRYTGFAPSMCWECEQTMGDAVVVPNGWWYETYDDDRTLSISAKYGGLNPGFADRGLRTPHFVPPPRPVAQASASKEDEDPEVIEFELVD